LARQQQRYGPLDDARSVSGSGSRARTRLFDYLIIEDSSMVPYTYQGSHDTYLRYAASTPKLDPAVLVPYLAQATAHLGVIPTLSVTEYPPFLLARLVNSLDHVTEGRVGWNCVTSSNDGAAQNYGHAEQPPHDERYDLADEFADLVTKLWDAWEPDAVVLDRDTPMFADGSKVHCRQPRQEIFPLLRPAECAALAARSPADLPGRGLRARAGFRCPLGRHDHHRGRQR
jgi:alkanesulfonate monooxygenase SsuD/methylene tetrahydromethanopterin reductase-like flavin-dependent oxidoreductase (luciferase family)